MCDWNKQCEMQALHSFLAFETPARTQECYSPLAEAGLDTTSSTLFGWPIKSARKQSWALPGHKICSGGWRSRCISAALQHLRCPRWLPELPSLLLAALDFQLPLHCLLGLADPAASILFWALNFPDIYLTRAILILTACCRAISLAVQHLL